MSWFVSKRKRDIPGRRWISIVLRTLHLVGIAGVSGGALYGLDKAVWQHYFWLAIVSGCLMVLKELYVDRIWLLQLRGQLIVIKLIILLLSYGLYGQLPSYAYVLIIVLSGWMSHAPGQVRYYSLWYQSRLKRDDWFDRK